jgi:Histidine kinase
LPDTAIDTSIPSKAPFAGFDFSRSALFRKRWLYHTVFWIVYYVAICVVIAFGVYGIHDMRFFLRMLLFFPFEIGIVYFNMYFLIPRLLNRGWYVTYGIALTIATLATAATELALRHALVHPGSMFYEQSAFNIRNTTGIFVNLFYLVGFVTAIKFIKASLVNQQLMKEREKQYLETELNFLKTQIQPHFFFNTLNNLYSLTLKKSDMAPEVVLKLSALMSYMLYESNAAKVPLSKEISYLQNYLDVEQLRFGQRLEVSFNIEGETGNIVIPPMILILFIENSFKHGVKNTINKVNIDISLKAQSDFLFFRVENPSNGDSLQGENNGIGLKNGKRRLDLLYGDQYTLDLAQTDNKFIVSLKIPVC